jgi:hypothetical protein
VTDAIDNALASRTEQRFAAGEEAEGSWLNRERERNVKHRALFTRLCNIAYGADCVVLVAHHVTYQHASGNGDEIASADTMLFCPELMGRVFGDDALRHMIAMASLRPGEREEYLALALDRIQGEAPCPL